MKEIDFNLLDEPWIIATNNDGEEETLSLTNILIRAHELRSLSGEMEAQDVAILRLLLGVLYAVYTRTDEYKEAQEEGNGDMCIEIWKDLWERKCFSSEEIAGYLNKYHDRFWLIHPIRPFYQVASLKNQKKSYYKASKIIGSLVESNNKIPLFSVRSNLGKRNLSYPEASRWLIHINGFDDAAFKTDNKEAGSIGTGWLGQLGLVYARGANLFETLMLNFKLHNYNEEPWAFGHATWELDDVRMGERTLIAMPVSGVELFTLQSRRILLECENDAVVGANVMGGDHFSKENAFNEPMTRWVFVKNKQKDYYVPMKEKNSSKQLWRDFSALLIESESTRRPDVLKWLDSLIVEEIIISRNIRICTLNVLYGGGSVPSGIEEVWSDSISVNAGLISSLNEAWPPRIAKVLELTAKLAGSVSSLIAKLEQCKGLGDGEKEKKFNNHRKPDSKPEEEVYIQLDTPFRDWLADIVPDNRELDYMDKTLEVWVTIAKNIICKIGEGFVEQAGSKAFVGRAIKTKDKKGDIKIESINAVEAFIEFRNKVNKHLKEAGYSDNKQ